MRNLVLSVFLLSCLSFGQTTPGPSGPAAPRGLQVTTSGPNASSQPNSASVETPASAPVITIVGFCPDAPSGTDRKAPDCKTVITREAFEKMVDSIGPQMSPQARQNLANEYAKWIVLSHEAKLKGIQESQRYKDMLRLVSMQVAAQELYRTLQEQAKPSDAEIQKYYQDNSSKFEELTLRRVFVPRNNPDGKPEDKMPTDDEMKVEGEKIKARLAAGEDSDKLQKEIYTSRGYQAPPPPTLVPDWRRDVIPESEQSLFNLKKGELSDVFVETSGASVYRLEEKKVTPLETLKSQIEAQLTRDKLNASIESLTGSIKPELNEAYFRNLPVPAVETGAGKAFPPARHTVRPMSVPPTGPGPSSTPNAATPKP